ncbi:MAG: HTH domain-containing protein [Gallionellaceae bacterium]|nr:HTH domain-containing protein [Gallionellaceae bacterium]
MQAIKRGKKSTPYFSVGFENMGQMLAVFTSKRWELIRLLRSTGPLSVAELARRLNRDYKNVHTDCERLIAWLAVEKNDQGHVFVPFSEIIVDLQLPTQLAA